MSFKSHRGPIGRIDRSGPRGRSRDILLPPCGGDLDRMRVISYRTGEGNVVIVVYGEVDHATAAHMRWAIAAAVAGDPVPRAIVLDLTRVSVLTPIGVSTLVVGQLICSRVGVPVRLLAD